MRSQSTQTRKQNGLQGGGELVFKEDRVSVWKIKKFWRLMVVTVNFTELTLRMVTMARLVDSLSV